MSTPTVTGDETTAAAEDGASRPRVEYLPPAGHDTVAAIERTYGRQEGHCAACGEAVSREDAVHEHLYTNDFSPRSAVAVCPGCRDRDGWRDAAIDRRRETAGRARGWVISRLRDYATQTIRATALAAVVSLVLATGIIAALVTGVGGLLVGAVTATPLLGVAGVCLLAVGVIAVWHWIDPRGYVVRERPAWYTTALLTTGGLALITVGVPPNPIELVGTGLWRVAWQGLAGVVTIGIALSMGRTVRADEAHGTLVANRTLIVGGVWVTTIISLGAIGGVVPTVREGAIPFIAAAPALASAVYLAIRARHDTRLHDQCIMLYDEAEDLLFGGPW